MPLSLRFSLREYLLNKLTLRRSISLSVRSEALGEFTFNLRIPGGIGGMPAKPITEDQLRHGVCWRANVDVMRTTATERWHTFYEEHPVGAWIFCPIDVTKTRKRSDQARPNRNVAENDEDVDNWLRGKIWDGSAPEMFNARLEWTKHPFNSAGLSDELVGPGWIGINDLDYIFRCITPPLSIMYYRRCHEILYCLT